jgi:hypothetical protein
MSSELAPQSHFHKKRNLNTARATYQDKNRFKLGMRQSPRVANCGFELFDKDLQEITLDSLLLKKSNEIEMLQENLHNSSRIRMLTQNEALMEENRRLNEQLARLLDTLNNRNPV